MHWFTDAVMHKYADFNGRAHRTEFWMFMLVYFVVYIGLGIVSGIVGLGFILPGLFALAMFVPGLAIGARRLHDTNRSGWWQLIGLIPFIGLIVMIVFLVTDSQPGDNQFGPNPKGVMAADGMGASAAPQAAPAMEDTAGEAAAGMEAAPAEENRQQM